MFKTLFSLFANLDGLNDQIVKMRQRFEEANAYLDSKLAVTADEPAQPAIEDKTHKNGRKVTVK